MIDQTLFLKLEKFFSNQESISNDTLEQFIEKFPDSKLLGNILSLQEKVVLLNSLDQKSIELLLNNSYTDLNLVQKSQILSKIPSDLLSKLSLLQFK